MSAKNKFVTLGVACASLAMVVFAQDDLDNLLQELGADKKPAAQEAPKAEEKPAAPKAEEKPAAPAEEAPAAPAAPEVKVPEAPPAPAAEEKKPEVEAPAPAPAPAAEEKKPEVEAPAPAPAPAAEEKKPEVEAPAPAPAPTAEEKKPEVEAPAPAPAPTAEEKKPELPAATPAIPEPAPAAEEKPEAAAPAAPAPAPAAEEKKPETEAPAPAPVAEEKKPEAPAPAPAPEPAAEEKKPEAPAPAPVPEPAAEEKKPEAPTPVPTPAPAATEEKPAAETPAPAAEEKKPEAPTAVPETPAASPAPAPAPAVQEGAEPGAAGTPPEPPPAVDDLAGIPDADVIKDAIAMEKLRREALEHQTQEEINAARAAMEARDWDNAYKKYSLAYAHLAERVDAEADALRKECKDKMAQAKYESAKQALKDGDRELAMKDAQQAQKLRHPQAASLIESLKSETTEDAVTDVAAIKHRRNDKDYKTERDTIRRRLRLASQYLSVLDLDKALEQADLVLREDPYNTEAIAIRTRIQRRRDMVIENEREATRRGMIADIGAAWRPVYAVNSGELKGIDGGTGKVPIGGADGSSVEQSIEKRMKEMILPSISFRPPATIIDAVDFFRQASKDFDRPEIPADQRGFNFVLQLENALTASNAEGGAADNNAGGNANAFGAAAAGDEAAPGDVPVIPNVNASNQSLWDALQLVCRVVKPAFKFKVQGSIIMVMPKTMTTDEMVTRSYDVVEDFVERMNNASSDLKNQGAGEFGGGGNNNNDSGEGDQENDWKAFFSDLGVQWPNGAKIKYIKALGKMRVTNTEEQLAILEENLELLNAEPKMIEVETRFVEVAQEDLNSLGFEWLLNSDYSFNVGGKLAKALNLKDGAFETTTTTTPGRQIWQNGALVDLDTPNTTTTGSTWKRKWVEPVYRTETDANGNQTDVLVSPGYYAKTGKNVGIAGDGGTTYQSGMRYLSTDSNHISGEGASTNDRFMRVNAFLGNADLSMILHMLSQRSDTDLLSAPKIVTKPGIEATIKVVTIYRYPQDYDVTIQSTSSSSSSTSVSGGGGGDGKILPMVEPQNFETQEVGVILTVTPELTSEGNYITLKLTPKVVSEPTWKDYGMRVPMDAVRPSTAYGTREWNPVTMTYELVSSKSDSEIEWFTVPMEQPFFKERSIDTTVTLNNGATVVMGGLITEERKSMEDKIPFLGDIPFLGRLFRSRSEWSDKRNLLLFVTARLVGPDGRMKQSGGTTTVTPAGNAPAEAAPTAEEK